MTLTSVGLIAPLRGLCSTPSRSAFITASCSISSSALPSVASRRLATYSTASSNAGPSQLRPGLPSRQLPIRSSVQSNSTILSQLRSLHSSPSSRAAAAAQAPVASAAIPLSSASSSNSSSEDSAYDDGTSPWVGVHLLATFGLVYAIIVVGGLTRLTESGLSITEWNPGTKGMMLPRTDEQWEVEWAKYRATPEWALLNKHMTLDDFKTIYGWEWGHRMLGRFIGVFFVLPSVAFAVTGMAGRRTRWKLLAIASGIGFQGALGWYMVKSGLTAPTISPTHPNSTAPSSEGNMRFDADPKTAEWTPRVSHFRLAAHLGTAFLVGLGCLHTAVVVLRPRYLARLPHLKATFSALSAPATRRYATATKAVTTFVFVTAMSGALVAGLDAGLVYNEFPTMGDGRIAPPMPELMEDRYALRSDSSSTFRTLVGNFTSNPVAVQLLHRGLAISSLCAVLAVGWRGVRLAQTARALGTALPPSVPRLAVLSVAAVSMQATLGICTLIYLVPIELASAHQAGSVLLLSSLVALVAALRRGPLGASSAARSALQARKTQVVEQALKRVAHSPSPVGIRTA